MQQPLSAQVSVACAIMAVEMGLICKSQTGLNCVEAAAETFTLNISATATTSQVPLHSHSASDLEQPGWVVTTSRLALIRDVVRMVVLKGCVRCVSVSLIFLLPSQSMP